MNKAKQISIVAALFIALALLLSAGCMSPDHYAGLYSNSSPAGFLNPFHHSPPPPAHNTPAPTVQDGLNRWIALFWSLGALAVVVGVLLILYTPFKSKGIWTIIVGVAAPILMTYVAIHIVKIIALAVLGGAIWYISTHKLARIVAAREIQALTTEAKKKL